MVNNSKLIKSSLSLGKLNRGPNSQYQLIQNNSDFFQFDLGYEFDLFWFDIPLGSFDVGLGVDILRDKVKDTTQKDPRIQLSWFNSIDFDSKKVRNYSEYLALIEVSEDNFTDEVKLSEAAIKASDFTNTVSYTHLTLPTKA